MLLISEQGVNGPSCNFWVGKLDAHGRVERQASASDELVGVCMAGTTTADGKRLVFTKFSVKRGVCFELRDSGRQIGQPAGSHSMMQAAPVG